ncbi:MAG: hypothetical protein ABI699_03615 [Caldimonas sp.]
MLQIRMHGRGGQGVVTAAEMLSIRRVRSGQVAENRLRDIGIVASKVS